MTYLILAGLLLLATPAAAQSIPLTAATFQWDWAGEGATEFRIKCGPTTGTYSDVTVVANPDARSFPVKNTLGIGSGMHYCVVTVANQSSESDPSAEVVFRRRGQSIIPQ